MSKHAGVFASHLLAAALLAAAGGCATQPSSRGAMAPIPLVSSTAHLADAVPLDKLTTATRQLAYEGIKALDAGNYVKASRLFNLALKSEVNNSGLHFFNALAYQLRAMQGEAALYDLAKQGYELSIQFDGSNAIARHYLGLLLMDQHHFAEAKQQLEQAALYTPDDADLLYDLAVASYYAHDVRTAYGAIQGLRQLQGGQLDGRTLRAAAIIAAAAGDAPAAHDDVSRLRGLDLPPDEKSFVEKRVAVWNDALGSAVPTPVQFSGDTGSMVALNATGASTSTNSPTGTTTAPCIAGTPGCTGTTATTGAMGATSTTGITTTGCVPGTMGCTSTTTTMGTVPTTTSCVPGTMGCGGAAATTCTPGTLGCTGTTTTMGTMPVTGTMGGMGGMESPSGMGGMGSAGGMGGMGGMSSTGGMGGMSSTGGMGGMGSTGGMGSIGGMGGTGGMGSMGSAGGMGGTTAAQGIGGMSAAARPVTGSASSFYDKNMVNLEVVLISDEEDNTDTFGVNLLDGLGVQFGDSALGTPGMSWSTAVSKVTGTAASTTNSITRMIQIPGVTYSLNIANSTDTHSEVLARPSLVAMGGQASTFFSGVDVIGAAVSTGQGGSVQVQKETGIKLTVTPEFLPDNLIKLRVDAERAFLTNPSSSVLFDFRLDTDRTEVSANVVMKFGETLILSGLSERDIETTNDGVPGLRDVPLVQNLFSHKTKSDYYHSVLIMITPRRPSYANRSEEDIKAERAQMSALEKQQAEFEDKYRAWFKPVPSTALIYKQLDESQIFREFRSGDLEVASWTSRASHGGRLSSALDFLFY
jgi:Tfp pilus assembly protein PilF